MGNPSINGGFSIIRLWAIFQLQMFTTPVLWKSKSNRWSSLLSEWESYPSFAIIISNSQQICLILPDITFLHICSIFTQFWYLLIVKQGLFFDVWNITPVLERLQQPFQGAARIHWGTFPWCSTCIDSFSINFNFYQIECWFNYVLSSPSCYILLFLAYTTGFSSLFLRSLLHTQHVPQIWI